jgi:hypothetical protein
VAGVSSCRIGQCKSALSHNQPFFARGIFIFDRPSGTRSNFQHQYGDKSPAYFLVVPPGHTGTAAALSAEMSKPQGKAGRLTYYSSRLKIPGDSG